MLIDTLKNIPIVLGSQSPRRKELLAAMDIDFDVEVYPVEEKINSNLSPDAIAIDIARAKLTAFDKAAYATKLVITADTIVVAPNGQVIGKPHTEQEAITMVTSLLLNTHLVITGVALQYKATVVSFAETTKVQFAPLSTDEIRYYIDKYRPYDKAGAYGIQEWIGRIGIDTITGSFENVMGLPTQRLYRELKKLFDCPAI
ncbi:septum formation protein Maf [Sphingobacterium sp. SGG-5]|uniref:Maf family nucleotide pyrophosphatase n=1 Tax=Sphingobacterium sp. SGG-5 TaxID=2710881 RepID=UPI0013EA3790|nr:Maf family nucleotide pyrophosphatase [Sphingobacterium sp. SGG-5]NGM60367.1 septum formation protein Maf [Sphingobacterium sp. SGG-5]